MTPTPEFSRIVEFSTIGKGGLRIAVEANADERARLASRFDLIGIDKLTATVSLTPEEGGRLIRLSGTFTADVVQTCVVTLEPLNGHLEAPIGRLYDTHPAASGEAADEEDGLDPDSDDPPDPAPDGKIDVGEAVAEELALGLDPFPRQPGISFRDHAAGPDRSRAASEDNKDRDSRAGGGAFAALAKIRDKLK